MGGLPFFSFLFSYASVLNTCISMYVHVHVCYIRSFEGHSVTVYIYIYIYIYKLTEATCTSTVGQRFFKGSIMYIEKNDIHTS